LRRPKQQKGEKQAENMVGAMKRIKFWPVHGNERTELPEEEGYPGPGPEQQGSVSLLPVHVMAHQHQQRSDKQRGERGWQKWVHQVASIRPGHAIDTAPFVYLVGSAEPRSPYCATL
jgi:hypothetical protein